LFPLPNSRFPITEPKLKTTPGIDTEITPSDLNFQDERNRWVSFQIFTAHLSHLTLCKNSNFTAYALYEFRGVLSMPPYPSPNPAGTPVEILNFRVPVAASWVLIAGKEVFENAEVTLKKWSFWQGRFREIGERGDASEETRKVAFEAAETMGVISGEAQSTTKETSSK
jgi:hypothetical protein